ncbi:MAG TPA: UMP kinase [Candidatus Limnocylindrales bacterium]|nr:UMP kinase [Candidatus Limnocylindrales bacterium]
MHRFLIKFSGEQLSGKFEVGIDPELVGYLAEEVKKALNEGCQIIMIAGGGNMVRGAEIAKHGIKRVTGDQMGMLSGLINSMAITDIFEAHDIPTRCLSNVFAQQVAESYSYRLAEKHLEKGRVVIIAGGIGRPYFTHDTAAVNLALELDCEAVLKATKVDGVYDKDPNKHTDAQKLAKVSYQQAVEDSAIKVMDKAAMGLAMEQHMPVIVFDAMQPGHILAIAKGEPVGTKIQ